MLYANACVIEKDDETDEVSNIIVKAVVVEVDKAHLYYGNK